MAIAPRYWKLARQYSEAAVAIIGLVVAWQVLCDVFNVPRWLLPSPRRIAIETWEIRAILPTHFLATLWAVLGGFALAIAAGIPLAIMVVYSPFLRRVCPSTAPVEESSAQDRPSHAVRVWYLRDTLRSCWKLFSWRDQPPFLQGQRSWHGTRLFRRG